MQMNYLGHDVVAALSGLKLRPAAFYGLGASDSFLSPRGFNRQLHLSVQQRSENSKSHIYTAIIAWSGRLFDSPLLPANRHADQQPDSADV